MYPIGSKAHARELLHALNGDCDPAKQANAEPRHVFYHEFMAEHAQRIIDPELQACALAQFGWIETETYAFAITIARSSIIPHTFAGHYILRIKPHWARNDIEFTFTGGVWEAVEFVWNHRTYINAKLKSFKPPQKED